MAKRTTNKKNIGLKVKFDIAFAQAYLVMSNEAYVQNKIRLAVGSGNVRLFRNNTGALLDQAGRLVKFGLCKGSSDLIGFKTVTITPDMVGTKVAVFSAIEVKDKAKTTVEQRNFINVITKSGGLAGVAKTVTDAKKILHIV